MALTVTHEDLAPVAVEVLHPQPYALHDAQAAAVEQLAEDPMGAAKGRKQPRNLVARENDGEVHARFCARDAVEKRELAGEDLAVEEQQRALRLVLSGRGDVQGSCQVRQERDDLLVTEIRRMAVAVKADEAPNPVHVNLFGAQAVMPEADAAADEVEKAWRRVAWRRR